MHIKDIAAIINTPLTPDIIYENLTAKAEGYTARHYTDPNGHLHTFCVTGISPLTKAETNQPNQIEVNMEIILPLPYGFWMGGMRDVVSNVLLGASGEKAAVETFTYKLEP